MLPGLPFLGGQQNERLLYFHALASGTESSVPLRLINDASIWERNPNAMPEAFQVLGSRGVQTPGNFYLQLKVFATQSLLFTQLKPWTATEICSLFSSIHCLWFAGTLRHLIQGQTLNRFTETMRLYSLLVD